VAQQRAQSLPRTRSGVERAVAAALQQVLGQQDAEDFVLVLAVHGKARVAGFGHGFEDRRQVVVDIQRDHLRTRHHHVAHHHLGDADRAFDHREGFAGKQAVALRFAEFRQQVLGATGFA